MKESRVATWVAVLTLVACGGGDSDEPGAGPSPDNTSSSGGGGMGSSGGGGIGSSGGGGGASSGGGGGASSGGGGASSGQAPVATGSATIHWKGQEYTAPIAMVRTFLQGQPLNHPMITTSGPGVVNMACNPGGEFLKGSRAIEVLSVTIAGGFGGSGCGPDEITLAENLLLGQARSGCNGRPSCTYDPGPSYIVTSLAGPYCVSNNVTLTWQYRCNALALAQAFSFVATAGGHSFAMTAMDGLGTASSEARGARFAIDDEVYFAAGGSDEIVVSARTERALEGEIEVSLRKQVDSDSVPSEILRIAFEHDDNVIRPVNVMISNSDICISNNVSTRTETIDEQEVKIYSAFAEPLRCQINPQATAPSYEVIRYPQPGPTHTCGAFHLRQKVGNVIKEAKSGTGCRAYVSSDTEERFAAQFYGVEFCAAGGTDCTTSPVVAIQADERMAP